MSSIGEYVADLGYYFRTWVWIPSFCAAVDHGTIVAFIKIGNDLYLGFTVDLLSRKVGYNYRVGNFPSEGASNFSGTDWEPVIPLSEMFSYRWKVWRITRTILIPTQLRRKFIFDHKIAVAVA